MTDATKRGVDVYFLYDEIGSKSLPGSYLADLEAAGVSQSTFNSTKSWRKLFQLNFRNHHKNVVIGSGHEIIIPPGRDEIDWEVEFGTVIGRPASYVSTAKAQDCVFGYTITIDVFDRGGRPGERTSDWFVGKAHNAFAPVRPWNVPKEFFGNPME